MPWYEKEDLEKAREMTAIEYLSIILSRKIIEEVWNTVPPVGETSIRFVRDMQTRSIPIIFF